MNANDFSFDDVGNAELFAAMFSKEIRFNATLKSWEILKGEQWEIDTVNEISQFVVKCMRAREKDVNPAIKRGQIQDTWQNTVYVRNWIGTCFNRARINACLALAKPLLAFREESTSRTK